jgi:deoxyadenosine/deoxycytidine kinase
MSYFRVPKITNIMHIGIAGNIGCGKTTLTRMLAEHYGWTPKFEAVTYNPYLEDYYTDIPRWSYNLETYFLAQRLKDVMAIAHSEETIVQDRTIFEGVEIFVRNNYLMGNLSERDFNTYMELFNVVMSSVKYPDLLIYIQIIPLNSNHLAWIRSNPLLIKFIQPGEILDAHPLLILTSSLGNLRNKMGN